MAFSPVSQHSGISVAAEASHSGFEPRPDVGEADVAGLEVALCGLLRVHHTCNNLARARAHRGILRTCNRINESANFIVRAIRLIDSRG